ncbi:MAG TPA: phosphoglycerate kinase, partial [Patescibacteria group bacterium]
MRIIQEVKNLEGTKVLLRVDFNVAVENGKAKESFKIAAVKGTVDYLLKKNAKIALVSHLGRPEGQPNLEFSLEQLEVEAENILGIKISFVSDCVGKEVREGLDNLKSGEILLLENVRFYPG